MIITRPIMDDVKDATVSKEIHRVFFRELHATAVNFPKELHLPAAQEKKLKKILQELRPPGDNKENQ